MVTRCMRAFRVTFPAVAQGSDHWGWGQLGITTTHEKHEIKNNAWVTVNNDFCHEWGNSAMIFMSDEVTSENHCRIASRVTKSLFTVTNVLIHFLHAILCHEHINPLRTIIERSFRHCCQGRPFLTEHCDVTTIDLWRHANAKYWYCDVIFVYCHCTRKLAQRRSSLVNNSVNIDISPPGIHGLACKIRVY